jgi:hypothetical protein
MPHKGFWINVGVQVKIQFPQSYWFLRESFYGNSVRVVTRGGLTWGRTLPLASHIL